MKIKLVLDHGISYYGISERNRALFQRVWQSIVKGISPSHIEMGASNSYL